jgi:hypothetical protein
MLRSSYIEFIYVLVLRPSSMSSFWTCSVMVDSCILTIFIFYQFYYPMHGHFTNLIPKSLFSMATAPWFTKIFVLMGLWFFIYKKVRKRTNREGPREPNGPAPHGQKVHPLWRHVPLVFVFCSKYSFSTKISIVFSIEFILKFRARKRRNFPPAKTTSLSAVFIQVLVQFQKNIKQSDRKINAYKMHQLHTLRPKQTWTTKTLLDQGTMTSKHPKSGVFFLCVFCIYEIL